MPYYWSENAKIGLQFLPKWTPDCVIPENEIESAEENLNLRFPSVLRNFYLDWGNHKALLRSVENFYRPINCSVQSGFLLFSEENQALCTWGIKLQDLENPNPAVYDRNNSLESNQWSLSFDMLSDYLDYLTFGHSFTPIQDTYAYGEISMDKKQCRSILLANRFREIVLNSNEFGLIPRATSNWPIIYNENTIISFSFSNGIAVKTKDDLEIEFIHGLVGINWKKTWWLPPDYM